MSSDSDLAWLTPMVEVLATAVRGQPQCSSTPWTDRAIFSKFSHLGYNIPEITGLLDQSRKLYSLALEDVNKLIFMDLRGGVDRARDALNCVLEALCLLGYDVRSKLSERHRKVFLLTYGLGFGITGTAVSWLKFHFAYLFSKGTRQEELPNPPKDLPGKPGVLGGGILYRVFQSLVTKADWSALVTLLQMKKGMPKVPESFISLTLLGHLEAMSKPDYLEEDPLLDILSEQVARTVDELPFKGVGDLEFLIPSMSGHYEMTGVKMGACAYLHKRFEDCEDSLRMWYSAKQNRCFQWYQKVLPSTWLDNFNGDFEDPLYNSRPVALPEPLKVRVITKGPSGPYYLCRYLQKVIHSQLRRMPGFELIGSPVTEEYLEQRLRWDWYDEGGCMLSGDYKEATNNIRSRLSERCVQELGVKLGLSARWMHVLRTALTGHVIDYRAKDLPKGYDGPLRIVQQRGQLMGSPVSFPILCIINMAVCRFFLECARNQNGITVKKSGICVNGDDVLLIANKEQYPLWKSIVSAAGLEPSIGKNYVDRRFCIINSELYRYWQDDLFGERHFAYTPYVNMGLLLGRSRTRQSDERELQVSANDLSSRHRDLLRGWDVEMRDSLTTAFLRHHKDLLAKVPEGMSYFLPRDCGGLGIYSPRADVSPQQLKLASFLVLDTSLDCARLTLPHADIRTAPYRDCALRRAFSLWGDLGLCPRKAQRPGFWETCADPSTLFASEAYLKSSLDHRADTEYSWFQYTQVFRRLWAKAQSTPLHPMRYGTAWNHRRVGWVYPRVYPTGVATLRLDV